ncbi:Hsp70 family protein [Amycolatopsis thermalba]|uniref:Hsp70 family protein n=1 Tax=Amycolatopsis thermalba TaxID=944492 RepID=A0ABY4P5S0_9PSEU|nr:MULTISPECIES: Hsp70 family protein [Amycolatopsis]UQS27618.1 Hsp70 family protein [Amycolatopsis thermalba]
MNVLSIDLGTSSTVAVLSAFGRGPRVIEIDGSVTMSSAIFAGEDGTLVVGQDAERRARLDPARFEPNPKRRIDDATLLLGDTVVEVTDALAAVLRRVAEEAHRQLAGQPLDQVRLSHPARWGATRQQLLRQAAIKAGLGADPVLIPEPVAAAAHYASLGRALAPGSTLAVYDLGAGTFDCAVIGVTDRGFTVLADNGLPDLGSLDIDQALLEHVGRQVSHTDPAQWQRMLRPGSLADRRTRRALLQDVREAKETLSRHAHTEVPMPEPFDDVLVTRAELEALVRPNLLRSAEMLAATIRDAGHTPRQLTGVYLVGGPSRMPLVATLLAEQLGVLPTTQDQPETAVAFGLHHVPAGPPPTPPAIDGRTLPAMAPATPPAAWQPPPPRPKPTGVRTPLLIGAGVGVLVAALVITLLAVTRGGSGDPVGTSGNAAQVSTRQVAATCSPGGEPDAEGFTSCLRRLAGTVPDAGTCESGGAGAPIEEAGAENVVTCKLPSDSTTSGRSVIYYEGMSFDELKPGVESQMDGSDGTLDGTWSGAGLSGRYLAGTAIGMGIMLFGADDAEICGLLVWIDFGGSGPTPQEMVDYFEQSLKPGA